MSIIERALLKAQQNQLKTAPVAAPAEPASSPSEAVASPVGTTSPVSVTPTPSATFCRFKPPVRGRLRSLLTDVA